ncbi:MAG TPA: transcription antitermination factor NusB [Phycisphaerales bacterium]|nr:transcription antitermination factor NusB [Phycisphaerales bacterium]HMP35833.1 transcription antitermination factor NusB [Phycisphaerales bacterium]
MTDPSERVRSGAEGTGEPASRPSRSRPRAPSARDVACERIAALVRRFPDLPIGGAAPDAEPWAPPDESPRLDDRDAALARAIEAAVRRRWLTLEHVLGASLTRPLESLDELVQATLLAGTAQLLCFDRLPAHAIVDEAVTFVRRTVRPAAAGFVNAVLRATTRLRDEAERPDAVGCLETGRLDPALLPREDGSALRLAERFFGTPGPLALARQCSLAPALVTRWWELHGPEETTRLCLHTIAPPPIIVATGPAPDARLRPHARDGFAVWEGPIAELAPFLAEAPGRRVQDPTAAAAIDAIAGRVAPKVIADPCAGRGTKTRQLAERFPDATIVASDPDRGRSASLRAAFAGARTVETVDSSGIADRVRELGGADLILVDVPCSNSGVLARRIEARYRFDRTRLESLVELQRKIVGDSIPMIAPGGALLYATCSLEPEENAEQWRWIETLDGPSGGMRRVDSAILLPEGGPGSDAALHRDGGGWALFAAGTASW